MNRNNTMNTQRLWGWKVALHLFLVSAGAAGVAYGRNIFQAKDPVLITQAIVKIVHDGYTTEDVMKELFKS